MAYQMEQNNETNSIIRYLLEIKYHGKNYHGWQIQKHHPSIEGVIENKLSILLKSKINIIGAGRTDTGVHATQMFAHFDFNKKIDKKIFLLRINKFLPKSIIISNLFKIKNNVHARFDALNRTYKYLISTKKNPFCLEICWFVLNKKISFNKMNYSSKELTKYLDFSSFSKKTTQKECIIYKAFWMKRKNLLIFIITANRFLRNMVRAIVGTIIDVGVGKISFKRFQEILQSQGKIRHTNSAPAKGLFLNNINYSKNIFLDND